MSTTKVLIVEDEAIVAADLASKLSQLGYQIAGSTARGKEAVALAQSQRPDVVLMDIRLAGAMDGIEAAEVIRRECDLPVIYLTAHSDQATLQRAKLTEPFGYILKPFEERELRTHIEMALYKHQAERKLREQREWLRVTLTSIGDAVIASDLAGRVTFLNPVAQTLTGWPEADALGQPVQTIFKIINEKTRAPAEDITRRVLREGVVVLLANHTALLTRDGREVPIEDSAAPIKNHVGQVSGVVVVFHDVTAQRQARETLRKSERENQVAAEFLRLVNASGGLRELIETSVRFFRKLSECEAVGIRLREGEDYPYFEAQGFPEKFVLAENSLCEHCPGGEVKRDSAGHPVLACMCGNVLCGRFDASKPFFSAAGSFWTNCTSELLANTSEADRQGRTRNRCNGEGYESVALIALRTGDEPLGLLQLTDRRKGQFTAEGIASWERLAGYLAVGIAKAQAEHDLQEAQAKLKAHAEHLERTVASRTAELQHNIAELEHFSYTITHDMRAPLRAMQAFAGLLDEECDGCARTGSKEYFRRIKIASDRMDRLITDSLNYSKAARQELTLEPVDLFQLTNDLVETYPNFQPDMADIQLEPNLPAVLGNEAALTQCFSNLLGNAVKFSKPGTKPQIHVWAESVQSPPSTVQSQGPGSSTAGPAARDTQHASSPLTPDLQPLESPSFNPPSSPSFHPQPSTLSRFVRIWVEDHGIGIPKDSQQRIFGMFQRASRGHEGTGIGLAIVRKVVERMGGRVGVQSEEGKGSRFWVDLCPAPPANPESPTSAGNHQTDETNATRIPP